MNNKGNIGIIGCGWLGKPLGKYLYNRGYSVIGTTTQESKLSELLEHEITPTILELKANKIKGNIEPLKNCEVIVLCIPPRRASAEVSIFENKVLNLLEELQNSHVKHILFISSTSVYGDVNGEIDHTTPTSPSTESGRQLSLVENVLHHHFKFHNTILRFGGLIGYDRKPGRFLANKSGLKGANVPVNLIHRDDCIEIIFQIIHQKKWGEFYNAAMPIHPTKKEFYTKAANSLGLTAPEFVDNSSNGKIINPYYLMEDLRFKFKYSDPLECI